MHVDVVVIGLGLIGSAALRRLAATDLTAAGIGPGEPSDPATYTGPFASHHDSGRITRRLDARYEWAELADRSIREYPTLEARSGIDFHRPVGMVFVRRDGAGIAHQRSVIERLGLDVTIGPTGELETGYRLPAGHTALVERPPAGHVDPRRMRAAQLAVAIDDGATVIDDWVISVDRVGARFSVATNGGVAVEATRVLLATGPHLHDLVPFVLAARVMPEAVALARVSDDEAERLAGLPSLIYLPDDPAWNDVYVVPPVEYPDGRWYVKIGGSIDGAEPLRSADEIRAWMAGPSADSQLDRLTRMLVELLPDVAFDDVAAKPCLITDTTHDLPYVDEIEDRLFVAVGGCGHAAKSSDAIGALAAGLVRSGTWPDTALRRHDFRAVTGEMASPTQSRHGY
ncbi:MAG: FAD-binding oxidoreductase [Ilumatobacter sp.]|nr:FAD-binding oxidoreductase [Ilumatobacter sp.]